ncbi:reverse transcriptase domain-containing protein, partial [Tanacetum coccineum]
MQNPGDISNPTTALDMALEYMSKAFQLNNTTPINNNQRSSSNPCYSQIAQSGHLVGHNAVQNQGTQNVGNQNGLSVVLGIANQHGNGNVVSARVEGNSNGINGNQIRCYNYRGEGHYASNCIVKPRKQDAAYLQQQLQIAQIEEAGIQNTQEEFDFMVIADGSAEVHHSENCYDNDIFNMFTQEEQYTKLLKPIPKPNQVQQNDSNVIYAVSSVEQSEGTVEQHPANVEET